MLFHPPSFWNRRVLESSQLCGVHPRFGFRFNPVIVKMCRFEWRGHGAREEQFSAINKVPW